MPISLHSALIPSYRQILGGVRAQIDKAEAHVRENGLQDSDLIEAALTEDMWTLPWHVRSCWVHTKLSLELISTGEFSPDFTDIPDSWEAMRTMIDEALAALDACSVDHLEAISDDRVFFVLGGKRLMEFTVGEFLLSFSQPNFYFHATTFYDILRMKGVALSKRDYLHAPRVVAG